MNVFAGTGSCLAGEARAIVHAVTRRAARHVFVLENVLAQRLLGELGHAASLVRHAVAPRLLHGDVQQVSLLFGVIMGYCKWDTVGSYLRSTYLMPRRRIAD